VRALVIGATGSIGRRLAPELVERGVEVACMVRDPEAQAADELARCGCELRPGDLTRPESIAASVGGAEVIYYLAHLMQASDEATLVSLEEVAARELARGARRAGVVQMIYLGGLGDDGASEHLRSRQRTAETLRAEGPPLTYFRAAMVVGAESESYVLLRSLVERLPAMAMPEWLENRTQPIGLDDVVEFLVEAPFVEAARGREIQLGGPEVMTYSEMVAGMAEALGEKGPWRIPTPRGIDSRSAGVAAATVTRGDPEVARHLTAGLATDTVVTDPSGLELFEIEPEPYRLALGRAIEDEARTIEDRRRWR
jgi:uncharacterized protein YbjT (DUF2867 family)